MRKEPFCGYHDPHSFARGMKALSHQTDSFHLHKVVGHNGNQYNNFVGCKNAKISVIHCIVQ